MKTTQGQNTVDQMTEETSTPGVEAGVGVEGVTISMDYKAVIAVKNSNNEIKLPQHQADPMKSI